MKRTLEAYSQQFTPLWEGFMGSEHTPSLAELEQLLTNCSAFIFHGMERFLANIPPSKLAALNLSDVQKSDGHLALERPLETALLLTLSGVRCVLLNQWHSSPQRNINNMDSVMENLLRVGLTSGQTVHALRKGEVQSTEKDTNTAGSDDTVCHEDSGNRDGNAHDAQPRVTPSPSAFNCVIYGLPNLVVT
ncbi:unnamed protein product [Coregonus sp. 'balchen']|nr:unnamed protein product [Coregonus sp. 'balchen']